VLSGRYGDEMFAVTEVPAMVHVTADTAESTPETVTVERGSDVYSTLKLDVSVKSIKLELFSGDSDLVCCYVIIIIIIIQHLYSAFMSCRGYRGVGGFRLRLSDQVCFEVFFKGV